MRVKNLLLWSLLFLLLPHAGYSQWFADVETGWVSSGYNDVKIPRETGTEFSLTDDLKTESAFFYRLRLGYRFGSKHTLTVLAAPLRLKASGSVNKLIHFSGEDFSAGSSLQAHYRFDSYRMTYRYNLIRKNKVRFGVGLTIKIRDAAISVEGNNRKSEKTNVGVVPLLNFRFQWQFARKFSMLLSGDAAAAPQGRAEDVLLALQMHVTEDMTLRIGYRILEGGADVEEVYNFALIHYISAGMSYRF